MSYDIIKNIRIDKDGKCFITAASSNCYPHTYYTGECTSISNMKTLADKEIAILYEFENGNFQKGNSKYLKAVKYAQTLPEYKKYCWRANDIRDMEATKAYLYRVYCNMPEKGNFILKRKNIYNQNYELYYKGQSSRQYFKTYDIDKAKVFEYRYEAERVQSISFFNDYEIIELKSKAENLPLYDVIIEFEDKTRAIIKYQQKFKSTKRAFNAISKKYKDYQRISISKV